MLKKENRLTKSKDFSYIYRRGKRYYGKTIAIYRIDYYEKLVGFSVSKKIGNAVTRNLFRRRLQELTRRYFNLFPKGKYIIVPNTSIKDTSILQLEIDFLRVVNNIDYRGGKFERNIRSY